MTGASALQTRVLRRCLWKRSPSRRPGPGLTHTIEGAHIPSIFSNWCTGSPITKKSRFSQSP